VSINLQLSPGATNSNLSRGSGESAVLGCLSDENVRTTQLYNETDYCSSNSISRQLRIGWNRITRFASLRNIEIRGFERRDFRGPQELHPEDLGLSIERFLDLPHVREFENFTRQEDALYFLSNEAIIRMASWPYLTMLELDVVPNLKQNENLATYKALEFLVPTPNYCRLDCRSGSHSLSPEDEPWPRFY
jgi:hypothetical protein